MQSINEEYRSTLEELETSKEELQSINEELKTVNQELQDRLKEISQANNDFQNLIAASEVATLFVDRQLRIKLYTPPLTEIFNIMPVDQGRPLAHVTHRLTDGDLLDDIQQVLNTLVPIEREVYRDDDYCYLMRLMPYRTSDDRIDGVVITFVDITRRRQTEAERQALTERLEMELADVQRLQEISTLMMQEGSADALYQQILDAAIAIMRSDMGSIQMLDPERSELRLLITRDFPPEPSAFWDRVGMDSRSSSGMALHTGQRVVVPDVETCEFMTGAPDLEVYRQSGIRAVQSTPLVSRSGRVLGMLSNHWRDSYEPSERDLRLLDVLARQAADLIERSQTAAILRQNSQRHELAWEAIRGAIYEHSEPRDASTYYSAQQWSAFLGYRRDELPSPDRFLDWLIEQIHLEDRERFESAYRDFVAGQIEDYRVEMRLRRQQGDWLWVRGSAKAIERHADGGVRRLLGMMLDISDFRQA